MACGPWGEKKRRDLQRPPDPAEHLGSGVLHLQEQGGQRKSFMDRKSAAFLFLLHTSVAIENIFQVHARKCVNHSARGGSLSSEGKCKNKQASKQAIKGAPTHTSTPDTGLGAGEAELL